MRRRKLAALRREVPGAALHCAGIGCFDAQLVPRQQLRLCTAHPAVAARDWRRCCDRPREHGMPVRGELVLFAGRWPISGCMAAGVCSGRAVTVADGEDLAATAVPAAVDFRAVPSRRPGEATIGRSMLGTPGVEALVPDAVRLRDAWQ